jgi:guanine deaminase
MEEAEAIQAQFMREAVRLARAGMRRGAGGPFGAVIVLAGTILARGLNCVTSRNDPTAHAEVMAIRSACRRLKTFQLSDCELYTSCEPCPMCLAAIYWARIPVVYFAGRRTDAATAGFDDDFLYRELVRPLRRRKVRMQPLLRTEALAVFEEWNRKLDKIPY